MGKDLKLILEWDLRYHLRDPVTILMMIVLPVLSYPLLFWGLSEAEARQKEKIAETVHQVAAPPEFVDWLEDGDLLERVDPPMPEGESDVRAEVVLPEGGEPALVRYHSADAKSRQARDRVREVLKRRRAQELEVMFVEAGLDVTPEAVLRVEPRDITTSAERAGNKLGMYAPLMLVLLVMGGGTYTALDLFTGEKERGTLETLLVSRVDRSAVLMGKFLVVLCFAMVTVMLALGSMWVTSKLGLFSGQDMDIQVTARGVGLLLLLMVPLTVQLCAILSVVAAWAPDFKTGQALALPVMMGCSAPAGVAMLPEVEFGPLMSLVPVTNTSLACREVLSGAVSGLPLGLTLLSTVCQMGLVIAIGARLMGREEIVIGATSAASRRMRGRYGPDAFGVFVASIALLWFLGQLAQSADMMKGMIFTQVVLMGGTALVALSYLGLPWRETMSIRAPRPTDWLLAVVAGATAPGLGHLVAWAQAPLMPASSKFAEQMAEGLSLDQPLWVVLVVFALLPAVCEELLFRGTIQGLLRTSLKPVARCLVIGALFGVMHLAVFRILPTGALGVLFAAALIRSRSLAVPITMHLLNNGLLLAGSELGWFGEDLAPTWALGVGAALSIGAVALMGRGRGRAD